MKRAAHEFNTQQVGLLEVLRAVERAKAQDDGKVSQGKESDHAQARTPRRRRGDDKKLARTSALDGTPLDESAVIAYASPQGESPRRASMGAGKARDRTPSGASTPRRGHSLATSEEFGDVSDEVYAKDSSFGTPKKSTGGSANGAGARLHKSMFNESVRPTHAWNAVGASGTETETLDTETETDADEEERTRIGVVSSPLSREMSAERGEFSADIERLVGSPLPRALSGVDADAETEAELQLSTPNFGVGGGATHDVQTPWTATPDATTAVGMKPADRAIGRSLFQPSPRVEHTGEAPLQYEKIATETMETLGDECEEVCLMLEYALGLRDKWLFDDSHGACPLVGRVDKKAPLPPKTAHEFKMVDGVMHVYEPSGGDANELILTHKPPGTATEFFHDLHALLRVQSSGPSKTFCHKRLLLTEQKFNLHVMLNADREFQEQKAAPHRDFYNVRKVDTHVHHSACMNQKHLLRFIKSKLKREPHELVIYRDGKFLNLREVFESIGMTSYELNVDTLDMHADKNTFHRFDKFNLKYNPCGQSRLREIFIKQDNMIRGRFLAELTKQVCDDLQANKYTMAEYRISIYGRKPAEWDNLAAWVLNNNVFSENIVWLIQIPRLYNIYHSNGTMKNFQQMLDNIFVPLFEVTVDPSSHPKLHMFLQLVVGVDMVDDESKPERRPSKHMRLPVDWDVAHNPAYAYYAYYVYANLYTLNALRVAKGLNTIAFRPHAGEAGDVDHLCATFMLAKNIAHGLNLRKSPCLQYLYYLAQIPMDMSPLSNNSLFIDYHKNPFPTFFARGLAVTLSTDDPLQTHMTKEPLVEEYSVAAQVWKLSAADLCEIAKTSVLNSGFPRASKAHWVSNQYWLLGPRGNDIQKTNVPNLRVHFREDVLETERALVRRGVVQARSRGRELRVRG